VGKIALALNLYPELAEIVPVPRREEIAILTKKSKFEISGRCRIAEEKKLLADVSRANAFPLPHYWHFIAMNYLHHSLLRTVVRGKKAAR
jgi:hypothetical protein